MSEYAALMPEYEEAAREAYIERLSEKINFGKLMEFERDILAGVEESGIFSPEEVKRIFSDISRIAMSFCIRAPSQRIKEVFKILSPTVIGGIVSMGQIWGGYISEGFKYSGGSRLDTEPGLIEELQDFAYSLGSDYAFYHTTRERHSKDPVWFKIDFYSPYRIYQHLQSPLLDGLAGVSTGMLKKEDITKADFLKLMEDLFHVPKNLHEYDSLAGVLYDYPTEAIVDYTENRSDRVAYHSTRAINSFVTSLHPDCEIQDKREKKYQRAIDRRDFCIRTADEVLGEYERLVDIGNQ